jgi:membrane fusion protein (multidrug efflux system)
MRMTPSKYLRALTTAAPFSAAPALGLAALMAMILATTTLPGCRQPASAASSNLNQQAGPQRVIVAVATVREQNLERTEEVQGALFPKERAVLAANVEGTIASISADFGDAVVQGQVLLKIDPREAQLRVDSAQAALDQERAKLANSRAAYNRAVELKNEQMMSAQQFDQLSAQLRIDEADTESAEKALAMARKKLGDDSITAPFAGSVQKRMASLGEYVMPGKQLYELIATDPIKLRCPMPERFVPLAKIGMPVQLTIDAKPGATYTGTITRIAPALDETSRTLLVEAEVRNPDGALKPGYFAHVTMNLGEDRALLVPQSAILRYAGVARVFVVQNGAVHTREVETGTIVGDRIEITKGLNAGEKVVITDIDRLSDGAPVIAQEQS